MVPGMSWTPSEYCTGWGYLGEPGITVAGKKMAKAQTMVAPWGVWSSSANKKKGGEEGVVIWKHRHRNAGRQRSRFPGTSRGRCSFGAAKSQLSHPCENLAESCVFNSQLPQRRKNKSDQTQRP